jgi:hypothetical protein
MSERSEPDDVVGSEFTIHCVTTRDRIASDVLMVRSTDDLEEVEKQLGWQPEWPL